ncbi:globin domain-containing protein [Nocardia stercoris]|uniref:nitric oxide dioxygenase n=1 Tax=Nocardia stercoris TaxID=2483361 RepID=A0A3M2L1A7_9NOCA|nr:globin domain-containing protein [Nocardia stercoris]RMI31351.1 hemin transporter [Nocardia stercoris]
MTTMSTPAPAVAELEEHHAEIVRATLPLVAAGIGEITAEFYRRLFAAHPELLRDKFNRGNQAQGEQQRALAASIATYAAHLVDPALPHPRELLSRIGHKHASLGVVPQEYPIVHEHLFGAIVAVLGADVVTAEVAAAWDRVYWLLADTLIGFERELYDAAGVAPGDVFREVVVVERIDDPSDVVTFVVESADPARPLPEGVAGQYISVGAELADGARQLRQYSLVDARGPGRQAFAVRHVPADGERPPGAVSTWLHLEVHVGDRLQVTLPFGDLTVDPDAAGPLVLISAGIGITPMLGILGHLHRSGSNRAVTVLHADRSQRAHPLRREQRALVAALPHAELSVWYEQPAAGAHTGTITMHALGLPADADYYLCGGTGFLQAMRAQCDAAGVPRDRVHYELFAPNDWLLDH